MADQNIGSRITPENFEIAQATRSFSALTFVIGAFAAFCAYRLLRHRSQVNFDHQIVLITGGSRGLGLVLAREFAAEGAHVVLCARDRAELDRARKDIEGRGGRASIFVCDVSDREQVEAMARSVFEFFGKIDVLVNVAGIIEVGPVEVMSYEEFQEVMATNFGGLLNTTFATYSTMLRQGGRMMNITSIGGTVPIPHLLPYTASKFASVGFSEGLSIEAARHGVKITTIVPGLMRTGSFLNALFKGKQAKELSWFSWGASFPLVSMSAERAARRMILACRRGESFVTVGTPAKALRLFHALFPTATLKLLCFVNELLPKVSRGLAQLGEPVWMHRTSASSAPLRNNEL